MPIGEWPIALSFYLRGITSLPRVVVIMIVIQTRQRVFLDRSSSGDIGHRLPSGAKPEDFDLF